MQLNITGRNLELTDPIKQYAEEKLGKIERHFPQLISTHVMLIVEKTDHKAEATVHAPGKQLFASATGQDMYAAIDGLVDKLDRQVTKHKENLHKHNGHEE